MNRPHGELIMNRNTQRPFRGAGSALCLCLTVALISACGSDPSSPVAGQDQRNRHLRGILDSQRHLRNQRCHQDPGHLLGPQLPADDPPVRVDGQADPGLNQGRHGPP